MGERKNFFPSKLVIGILINHPSLKQECAVRLAGEFGPEDYISPLMKFTFTDYYNREMGDLIQRFFISFKNPVQPQTLADIKILTNSIEEEFSEDNRRKINLDPGLLNLSRFILATTKDGSHRIPLQKGIYGEITLLYEKGAFRPLPWTYPDYRCAEYNDILEEIRSLFKAGIKADSQ